MRNGIAKRQEALDQADLVAGNGLMSRRALLTAGGRMTVAAAAGGMSALAVSRSAAAEALSVPPSMTVPGAPMSGYGQPSPYEEAVQRGVLKPYGDLAPGTGVSMTPLQHLAGTITPNGLHFERHHNGVPSIDPETHKLLVHGLVKQNLIFTVNDLLRYPMTSRTCFLECSGNSFFNSFPKPMQMPCGMIHGLISGTEWTGIPLATLLDEAGVDPKGKWILAEGADSAGMSRSVPLDKVLDDCLLALYQNGERLRPEQGYPMRLLVPGWEGNMNVKWLHRIKVTEGPTETKDETSKYTDLQPDGIARQFTFPMGVKSVITHPSAGLAMQGPGFYEVSGLAWSGHGTIAKVEVSADGGNSWAEAALQEPVMSMMLVRFRLPWRWDGSLSRLMSRAVDDQGNVQPSHEAWAKQYATGPAGNLYHCNAVQTWEITAEGEIANVYV
ncbi:MAG: sulfite dehydrogenase [Rhodospirillaceae bacterium]|nr:sulfite dehydrogenase [Rhodospirillaceae bacterium]